MQQTGNHGKRNSDGLEHKNNKIKVGVEVNLLKRYRPLPFLLVSWGKKPKVALLDIIIIDSGSHPISSLEKEYSESGDSNGADTVGECNVSMRESQP